MKAVGYPQSIANTTLLSMPRSLLPPLAAGKSGDDRKNVMFDSKYGGVDVSISAPNVYEACLKKQTSLDIKAERGSIHLKLRTCPSPSTVPIPFFLNMTGFYSSVNVALPHTFQGPMTVYSSQHCFVGDISLFSDKDGGWKGDEVNIRMERARVKVQFVDEAEPETPSGKAGLIFRMFGAIL
ncbi:hypothetical protein PILCRDRAFT_12878 [Piloderma croceum F 1598]|uniref:DUF7330 domain-containing protein n=1 Tax=Piloderma croceum (strain F 1598) TaxID=765440 RepID=A0A0C3BFZ3_PILCF|nr:hypothetical protein PILCRDRAFT_12878 [Piloderma croceum F 1598]